MKIKKKLKPLSIVEVQWIIDFARKIMGQHDCAFYANYLKVKPFNSKKTFARAGKTDDMCGSMIEISLPWWRKLDEWQKEELIAHETCHIVVDIKHIQDKHDHHGPNWKALMVKSGYAPSKSYRW